MHRFSLVEGRREWWGLFWEFQVSLFHRSSSRSYMDWLRVIYLSFSFYQKCTDYVCRDKKSQQLRRSQWNIPSYHCFKDWILMNASKTARCNLLLWLNSVFGNLNTNSKYVLKTGLDFSSELTLTNGIINKGLCFLDFFLIKKFKTRLSHFSSGFCLLRNFFNSLLSYL